MKKKVLLGAMVLFLTSSITAFASTMTKNLHSDYCDAEAKLKCTWSWFGEDTAEATTTFTNKSGNYRVAVRLEEWDEKDGMTDFKYKNNSSKAYVSYSKKGVYQYCSRHSIDNSKNTKELEATSLYER